MQALREFVAHYRTQKDAAAALSISAAYLSDMLNCRRAISENILAQLGLRTTVVR